MQELKDALTIFYISLGVGGVIGGIMKALDYFRSRKFLTKEEHKESQELCQNSVCSKIDTVTETVTGLKTTVEQNAVEAKERREKDNEFLHEHLINISEFVGSVKQYMTDKKL